MKFHIFMVLIYRSAVIFLRNFSVFEFLVYKNYGEGVVRFPPQQYDCACGGFRGLLRVRVLPQEAHEISISIFSHHYYVGVFLSRCVIEELRIREPMPKSSFKAFIKAFFPSDSFRVYCGRLDISFVNRQKSHF